MTLILLTINVLLGGTVVYGLLQILVHGIRSDAALRPRETETRTESFQAERLAA